MDFLPLPHDSLGHVVVPDLGGPEWDVQQDFKSFPARCGWNLKALREGESDIAKLQLSGTEPTLCRIDQCLQTWMFRGTLSIAFRHPISGTQYSKAVSSNDGTTQRVLCTETWLGDLRPPNQKSVLNHTDEENKQELEDALDLAALVLLDLTRIKSTILPDSVHLHLAVHVYFLQFLSKMHRGRLHVGSVFANSNQMFDFRSMLTQKGWCPSLLERISATGTPGLYYCSRMGEAPDAHSGRIHDKCSDNGCVALNIDESTYKTRHFDASCTCQTYTVSTEELVRLIKAKKTPLVEIHNNAMDQNDPRLVIKAAAESDTYVAISHVWSDGLGNVEDNAMPLCQLLRIAKLAQALVERNEEQASRPQAFWMDTLCVPVSETAKTYRTEAIRRMGEVYRSAQAVLVLDQTMTSMSQSSLKDEETLLRISCCNWMTRLWTLQEGALADRLFFQFKDTAVNFNNLQHRNDRIDVRDPGNFLAHRATSSHIDVFSLKHAINRYHFPLAAVWRSLSGRSTSRARDAPVCVGTLIGLDVKQLIESDDIMEEFWKLQAANIPSSILWVNSERLPGHGFRWAPASLLQPRLLTSRLTDECKPAKWHPVFGLTVTGVLAHRLRYVWTPTKHKGGGRRNASGILEEPPFDYVVTGTGQHLKIFLNNTPGNGPWDKVDLHLLDDAGVVLYSQPITSNNSAAGVLAVHISSFRPGEPSKLSWRAAVHVQEADGHFERVKGYAGAGTSRTYSTKMAKEVVDPETRHVRDAEGEPVDINHVWMIR